jgi:hypothetical protein
MDVILSPIKNSFTVKYSRKKIEQNVKDKIIPIPLRGYRRYRHGKVITVVDDEDRENEGDF